MSYRKALAVNVTPAVPSDVAKRLAMKEDNIRLRAYELYCERKETDALADWLHAEHEMELLTCTGIEEFDDAFHVEAGLPGYNANQLNLIALPDAIIVEGRGINRRPAKLTMLRLPAPIRPETLEATFNRGVLAITVQKSVEGEAFASAGRSAVAAAAA
jgi:HSP20 family molecular chaperone IbpA